MEDLQGVWHRYRQHPTPELRCWLIEAYAPLTRYVVDRLNLRPGSALEQEDLLSQAMVGLIAAVDRFDPTRGIKFETYAYHRIRGAVIDMLRELDWVPRSMRQQESEIADAFSRLEARLRRPPADEELAAEMGVTLDQFDLLAQELAFQTVQSLEDLLSSHDSEARTVADLVADDATPPPQQEAEREAERRIVARAVDALPEAERTVVSLYYYDGLTLKEIGRALGVTESRACQIHGKAMLRLRAEVRAQLKEPALSPS